MSCSAGVVLQGPRVNSPRVWSRFAQSLKSFRLEYEVAILIHPQATSFVLQIDQRDLFDNKLCCNSIIHPSIHRSEKILNLTWFLWSSDISNRKRLILNSRTKRLHTQGETTSDSGRINSGSGRNDSGRNNLLPFSCNPLFCNLLFILNCHVLFRLTSPRESLKQSKSLCVQLAWIALRLASMDTSSACLQLVLNDCNGNTM